MLALPEGAFDTGLARKDVARLNTGKSLPEFRETFEGFELDPGVWTRSIGAGVATYSIEPGYADLLRIRSSKGTFAHVSRALDRDNVSVRVRMCPPEQGKAPMPAVHLYWGKARFVSGGITNPRPDKEPNAAYEMRFGSHAGKRTSAHAGPEAGRFGWVRFDLEPEAVRLYASADGQAWAHIGDVPRQESFAGAPTHLVLGFGHETPLSQNDLLRNTKTRFRRGGCTAFFGLVQFRVTLGESGL